MTLEAGRYTLGFLKPLGVMSDISLSDSKSSTVCYFETFVTPLVMLVIVLVFLKPLSSALFGENVACLVSYLITLARTPCL